MIKKVPEISSWILNWIKKIFHIHSKSKKVDTVLVQEHEDKKNEQGKEDHKPTEVPSVSPPVIVGAHVAPEKTQEEGEKGPHRPYVRKPPTERDEKERRKIPTPKEIPKGLEQEQIIYLGRSKKRKSSQATPSEGADNQKKISGEECPKRSFTIESPFIEIDLDHTEVHLILPRQQFISTKAGEISSRINYQLELNEDLREFLSEVTTGNDGSILTEEKRILIESPLRQVKVSYPAEIEKRVFTYNHNDAAIYIFAAIGNNRGRMYYLFDEDGVINPLPKRDIWILLDENYNLKAQPDVIEERWVWNDYKSYRINLGKFNNLEIMNTTSGDTKSFSIMSTFCIEGEQLIEDDFRKECPLFTDKTLKIIAPRENPPGWNVWIQNKIAGFKVKENWNGAEPLILNLPQDLPCDCGEFQVDICQQDIRIPEESLFFRWIPNIELDYPKRLIIPDTTSDDMSTHVRIKLDNDIEWELEVEGSEEVERIEDNIHILQLPVEKDTIRFSIVKSGKLETIANFQITIRRVKWKTSKQDTWDWRPQKIERREIRSGEPFYLLLMTNDFDTEYDLIGILETRDQPVQQGRFIKKGMEYTLELNQFYETIRHYKSELSLRVKICQNRDGLQIGKVDILNFPSLRIKCRDESCSFATYNIEDIKSHFQEHHLDNFIEHLTYEELRVYDRSLPHAIYQCRYCDEYIRANDSESPTSLILRHIEQRHQIRIEPTFRVISNIDEIRERVFPGLNEIYKCKFRICGNHFRGYTREMQVNHLFERHGNEIFEYSED